MLVSIRTVTRMPVWRLTLMLALLGMVALPACAEATEPSGENAEVTYYLSRLDYVGDVFQINQELRKIETYVHYVVRDGARIQVLDAAAALDVGVEAEIVALAADMISYQNDLVHSGTTARGDRAPKPSPRLTAFLMLATSRARVAAEPDVATAVDPCGDWTHPVPNYSPAWVGSSTPNPEGTLLAWGFHHTASYACGYGNCSTSDFTRPRSYAGPYGTCASPRFRDHGRIWSATSVAVQYGEPNPEVLSYSWPYWDWGTYVQWWHQMY